MKPTEQDKQKAAEIVEISRCSTRHHGLGCTKIEALEANIAVALADERDAAVKAERERAAGIAISMGCAPSVAAAIREEPKTPGGSGDDAAQTRWN